MTPSWFKEPHPLAGANDPRAIYRWGQRLRPEALPLCDITNGHYLFVVKNHQPALKAGIAEAFGDDSPSDPNWIDNGPPSDLPHAQTAGKEHERIETRQIADTA